ncbi:mitogen-activated protein kinase kinase kinase 20 [Daucus carota subsp. sativus]|nr:PREDICTED: mitogen-activated protein kinase kinase kinase NPK1-like [Daucus carota subsp. sativus]XP_017254365.1 PREDICTED: mitogen-activated protein kinase kinase kinase NPK1-like [Daucus carota subsp. sativus]XP_017254366.1 PREDICTED: mitogen-activated protein kinase kinase kinase NPK1-like [Daucus carota subsp. sativus]
MMVIKEDYDGCKDRVEQKKNRYGDGVAWFRGALLGKGSFGSVFLATLKKPKSKFRCFPPVMAIKSAEVSVSGSIQKEREVLSNIGRCDYVIRCFGDEITTGENGGMVYNLLLEYGAGGTLADVVGDGGLAEFDVKRYTRDIVRGIYHIHSNGYVHCDLKPDNVLLVGNRGSQFRAKICDLGLAKRGMQSSSNKKRKLDPYFRGTPMYLSPEALADGVQESPADIWALGCILIEMLTGKSAWDGIQDLDGDELLERIAEGREMPRIPSEISIEAKNFLKSCLARKPMYRWTAEMLLNHPYLEGLVDVDEAGEYEEVSDVNADSSLMLLSEADDELGFSFWEDDSFLSEEESVSYWSEDEENGVEVTGLAKEATLNIQESADTASSRSDSEFKHAMRVPVPSNTRHQYPIAFTIPAGV